MAVKPALSDVLTNSPLAIMERHAEACLDCVNRLGPYFEAVQADQWGRAEQLQQEIARLEALADDIKMDVRKNLPRGLWMSVSRPDLLELVRVQDKMANETKDIAGLILGRQLMFPKSLRSRSSSSSQRLLMRQRRQWKLLRPLVNCLVQHSVAGKWRRFPLSACW